MAWTPTFFSAFRIFKLTRIPSSLSPPQFSWTSAGPDQRAALTPQVPTGCQKALLPSSEITGEDVKYLKPRSERATGALVKFHRTDTLSHDLAVPWARAAPRAVAAAARPPLPSAGPAAPPQKAPPVLCSGPPAPHSKHRTTAGERRVTGRKPRAARPSHGNASHPWQEQQTQPSPPLPARTTPQTHATEWVRALCKGKLPPRGKQCWSAAAGGNRASCEGQGAVSGGGAPADGGDRTLEAISLPLEPLSAPRPPAGTPARGPTSPSFAPRALVPTPALGVTPWRRLSDPGVSLGASRSQESSRTPKGRRF